MPRARRGAAPPTPAVPSGRRGGRKGHLPACMGHRNAHRPPAARTAPPLGAAPSKGRAGRQSDERFFLRGSLWPWRCPPPCAPRRDVSVGGLQRAEPAARSTGGAARGASPCRGKGRPTSGRADELLRCTWAASQPEARADGGAFMRGDRSCAGDAPLPAKRGLRQEYADPLAPRQRHAKLLAGAAHGGRLSLTAAVEARALRSNRNPRLPADCFLLTWTPTAPRRAGQRHDQARRG